MSRRSVSWIGLCLVAVVVIGLSPLEVKSQSYEKQRRQMVSQHIVDPAHGAGISDTRVIEAMRTVPRHLFVRADYRHLAYLNRPLPIGEGQTISQPYIVALMTQLLRPEPGDRILEVGTGSGYQAAVLAEIVGYVYTIEIKPELAEFARSNLSEAGYDNVVVKEGDGYFGWEEHAPFDGIVVTAAPDSVPEPLKRQLKVGGRLVLPVESSGGRQNLKILEKRPNGTFREEVLLPVRFVPFLRSDTS